VKRFEIFFGIIKIPVDFFITILGFKAAYELRLLTEQIQGIAMPIDYTVLPTQTEYLIFSVFSAIALIIIYSIGKMYSLKANSKFSHELGKSIMLGGVWIMFIISYFFFTRTFPFSRLAMLYSWVLTIAFIIFGRALVFTIQQSFLKSGIGKRNILFIGNNSLSNKIIKKLKNNISYKIIGIISEKNNKSPIKILGNINQLEYIIKKHNIDEIIQTNSFKSQKTDEEILGLCDYYHIHYRFIPNQIDLRRTNIEINTIGTIPIISLKPTPLDGWGRVLKRLVDIIGSISGLIILSPLLLLTAIIIKVDSKGPIIFSKLDDGSPVKRIGEKGKPFKFYKFRSMKPNTDKLRYTELAKNNTRTDGPLVKIENDPRITKVGKFIRKTSIDELPQLWNVLTGKLSLVGPRPHLPEEVAKYKKHHRFVLTIKPGITGLAQISGRSDLQFEDEIKLDRYYIENWSILLDIKIIFKTIGVLIKDYKE